MQAMSVSIHRHKTKRRVSHLKKLRSYFVYPSWGLNDGFSKLFKVSAVAVLKWIRKASDNIPTASNTTALKAEIVQEDEVLHFINGKKQNLDLEGCGWGIT